MKRVLNNFFSNRLDPSRPVLLGLSGGPDSLCLLHMLLEYRKGHRLELHIAHIDHGWRAESAGEAERLRLMAQAYTLPFHLHRMTDKERQGNLEASAREARLRFFKTVCLQHNCQAVLLAHQAEDVRETLFKRTLEGVSLAFLNGFSSVTEIDSLVIWRPLLQVSKQAILAFSNDHQLVPFQDETNFNPRFLRGKMRTAIMPELSELFGKEVSENLSRLAEESSELKEYLDARLAPVMREIRRGPLGSYIELGCQMPAIELRHLVRCTCESHDFFVSREILRDVVRHIQTLSANKCFEMGKRSIVVDRGRLFVLKDSLCSLPEGLQPVSLGTQTYGQWTVTVQQTGAAPFKPSDWRDVWQGSFHVTLPAGTYALGRPVLGAQRKLPHHRPILSSFWTNAKVPAFLRNSFPVLWRENMVYHDFLSGRLAFSEVEREGLDINLEIRL